MRSVPARAALLGAVFAALVTLPGLGIGTLWDNSETAYGEVAREIVRSHDWVVMHLNTQPWFVQPPLYFWIAALFADLFGPNAFALRLPSALATIAMGGAVGYATARIAGERAGMIAAIVLSTSLMQAIVGRLAIMDALLDFSVAAAVLWWYRAFEPSGSARRRDTAFCWVLPRWSP
jgi:4-amino-4-deoxy-L-arabinose transferase-like glycosyltransferase